MDRIIRWTKPSRGRARREEDEKDEKTDLVGLDRPLTDRLPPSAPRLKKDGAECREWWVE